MTSDSTAEPGTASGPGGHHGGRIGTGSGRLRDRRAAALARYVVAATLVRSADGGAVVAIVLLALDCGLPGWLAGVLGASITAPHLLGPFIARRLDTADDGRKLIALSAVLHGVLLGAAALLLPVTWPLWPALLLFASGLFGPMLTGGISSRLPAIAGPAQRSQRRAQSWDVASYGLAGTLGPAAVAWIAAAADPLTATLLLASAAVLGAGGILALPRQEPPVRGVDVPGPVRTLRLMVRSGPLRRTLLLTVTVAFSVAALPISAAAATLDTPPAAGALVAAYGIGNLLGSAALMIRPLRRDADRLMSSLALLVAVMLTLTLLTPGFSASLAAFGLTGTANALFFAATLAGRSEYAPQAARGQVFIWVGALKIAAGSAGTAAAGAVVTFGSWVPLGLASAATVGAAAISVLDRSRSGDRPPR
ncbi:MFS transporter [Arthrobacter crusticola]|uniref:MFS transporter n=1 Tax=Arthrobacter crusticola TaxID=2547960 RepID=UPI001FEA93E3|nr:MFS transporter [Arthrobacter crusticola]